MGEIYNKTTYDSSFFPSKISKSVSIKILQLHTGCLVVLPDWQCNLSSLVLSFSLALVLIRVLTTGMGETIILTV